MALSFTEEQLNNFDKNALIQMLLMLDEQNRSLQKKLDDLDDKMQKLIEQLILEKQERFGRSSEKLTDADQICFREEDGVFVFFNESEAVANPDAPEPDDLEKKLPRGKKTQGKKEQDMLGLPVSRKDYYLSEDKLEKIFGPGGWKQLPDEIIRKYEFIPARISVLESHVGVYAGKRDNHIEKAPHPRALLRGSKTSASLCAAIINGKYVNAVPLYRLEKEFERYGLAITRQNMANWMIRIGEEYLGVLYDYLHKRLYDYHVIQADETPFYVNKDNRPAGSKSWMWVYRSGEMYQDKQIVLYEYQKTRNTSHPRMFLKEFQGICVTDGYQVYHSLEKEKEDLTIAGCWVHGRRKFDEYLKTLPKAVRNNSEAYLVMQQIRAIYREEGKLKDLIPEDRVLQRQLVIRPLVEALFAYLKDIESKVSPKGKFHEAITYMLNQEKYLKVFLADGEVPMDNNASERSIKGFCIGKKNWMAIDTVNGAKTSAIIYSIAETAKANNLKPYEYFKHLLTEIPEHMEDKDLSFLGDLLPWSPKLPDDIRKPVKKA